MLFVATGYNGGCGLFIGSHYGAVTICNHGMMGEVGKDAGGDWWVTGTYFHGFFFTYNA